MATSVLEGEHTVQVDLAGIKRSWSKNDREAVSLVFVPDRDRDGALVAAAAAVDAANEAVRAGRLDGGTDFACTEPWPGPRGPVFQATIADTVEGLVSWTSAFARALEAAGWNGKLKAESTEYPGMMSTRVVALSAVLAVAGWEPRPIHQSTPGWFVDPDLGARIFDWAVDWVAHGDSSMYLGLGLTMFRRPVSVVRHLLPSASAPNTGPQLINSQDVDHVRLVRLDESGRMIVQLRDLDRGWDDKLRELLGVLERWADASEFGLIRFSLAGETNLSTLSGYPPPQLPDAGQRESPSAYYYFERYLDGDFVPDAYGCQVISQPHFERTHDLSSWDVTDLGTGKYLVRAKDLSAWYATESPEAAVVERARRDFGGAILRGQPERQQP